MSGIKLTVLGVGATVPSKDYNPSGFYNSKFVYTLDVSLEDSIKGKFYEGWLVF